VPLVKHKEALINNGGKREEKDEYGAGRFGGEGETLK